jgi:hypothetical protein
MNIIRAEAVGAIRVTLNPVTLRLRTMSGWRPD